MQRLKGVVRTVGKLKTILRQSQTAPTIELLPNAPPGKQEQAKDDEAEEEMSTRPENVEEFDDLSMNCHRNEQWQCKSSLERKLRQRSVRNCRTSN